MPYHADNYTRERMDMQYGVGWAAGWVRFSPRLIDPLYASPDTLAPRTE